MRPRTTLLATLAATTLAAAPLAVPVVSASAAAAAPTVTNGCLSCVPDPGTNERVQICYTVFKPSGPRRAARSRW